MYHRTDLVTIEGAIIHGLGQKALDFIPLIEPWSENDYPPTWWYNYDTANTWRAHLSSRRIPDTWLIDQYLRYCWRMIGFFAEEVGTWARDTAQTWARSVTGYALYGWTSLSNWIDSIGVRLGSGMVWWKDTAVHALDALYNWLPPEIRTNLQSWGTLLNYWIQKAKDWVIITYHYLIALGLLAWNWVGDSGTKLKVWWEGARGLLDEFRGNPAGFIIARLGTPWPWLVWFVNNALQFYITLWGWYHQDLSDFLADPAGWIVDRVEVWLVRFL